MRGKKRVGIGVLLVAILWLSSTSDVWCESPRKPTIQSKAAVLVDGLTGRVLLEQDPETRRHPASLAKMMTLFLVLDAIKRGDVTPDEVVVVSERAWKMGGSQMFLEVGDRVQLRDLIQGVAIVSANDGALAIAESLAGSEEAFVQQMNEKARGLGMDDTHFVNPHGLPRKGQHQYTTASDMATLGFRYVNEHPEALKFHGLPTFEYGGIKQKNWNPLLNGDQGVNGLKTGYLKTSGYHILFSAERNGQRLVGVVMGGATPETRNQDARELIEYGFNNFTTRAAVKEGEVVGRVKVPNGDPPELELAAAQTLMVTVRNSRANSLPLKEEIPASVQAPISKGSVIGKMVLEGEGFGTKEIDLVASQDVGVKSYARYYGIGIAGVLGLLGLVLVKNRVSQKRRY